MRHRKLSQRLSRPLGPRRATLRNLVINLLKYQKIRTTRTKAKRAQSVAEHLISLGRQNTLQSRRNAFRILNDKVAVGELFWRIAPLFKNRACGFSRIIGSSNRRGDGAVMVFLELSEQLPKVKPQLAKKERLEKKEAAPTKAFQKPEPEVKPEEKPRAFRERPKPAKKLKPKKFLGGLRKLFKKERDSL